MSGVMLPKANGLSDWPADLHAEINWFQRPALEFGARTIDLYQIFICDVNDLSLNQSTREVRHDQPDAALLLIRTSRNGMSIVYQHFRSR